MVAAQLNPLDWHMCSATILRNKIPFGLALWNSDPRSRAVGNTRCSWVVSRYSVSHQIAQKVCHIERKRGMQDCRRRWELQNEEQQPSIEPRTPNIRGASAAVIVALNGLAPRKVGTYEEDGWVRPHGARALAECLVLTYLRCYCTDRSGHMIKQI